MRVDKAIELLRRFPQCAQLDDENCNIYILAPLSGGQEDDRWHYYRIDAEDAELPWLNQP